jgi:hypothetical protein
VDGNLDPSTVSIVAGPSHGSVVVDPVSGEITYTPDANYSGSDVFTYQVCDSSGDCSVGTAFVTTTVVEIDDPPVANPDAVATPEDTAVTVDVVANDSDVDGNLDPSTVSIVAGPSHGSVVVDPVSGEITYTPKADYNGSDSVTYQVCDTSPTPLCDVATVTVTVDPTNDPPVHLGAAVVTVGVGGRPDPLQIIDPEGDDYTVTIASGALPPGLHLSQDGALTGEATTTGTFSVTYRACDDQAPPACGEFTVVYRVEVLALTGVSTKRVALGGMILILIGMGLLVPRRQGATRRLGPPTTSS